MKRWMCLLLCAVLAFGNTSITAFAKPVWPSDTGIESEAGIVMDMDSGTVLFGQNIHVRKAPASITKLLTALVVIENSDLSDMVTFSNDAVYNVESGSGNKLALDEGDVLSVEDCLYLLLLQSSNQAANALAEHVAGSRDAFVELMNQKVEALGCENSNFANPSGLNDEKQYTTAFDMALIGIASYKNEKLLEINSSKSHKIPATKNNPNGATFGMEHKLLITTDPDSSTYFPYAVAGKTGYTSIAGQTLVTYAKKGDRRLMCVTLKSTEVTHYKDTIALLSFGFDKFQNMKITGTLSDLSENGTLTVGETSYELSGLSIDENAVITLPVGAEFTDAVRTVSADIPKIHEKGTVALLTYTYDDRKIGQVAVISPQAAAVEETAENSQVNGSVAVPGETEDTKAPEEEQGKKKKDGAEKAGIKISARSVFIAFLVLASAALVCFGFLFYFRRKEAERRRIEERRQRRMQRLEEMGYSQEEFNSLLQKRINKSGSQSGGAPGRRRKKRRK